MRKSIRRPTFTRKKKPGIPSYETTPTNKNKSTKVKTFHLFGTRQREGKKIKPYFMYQSWTKCNHLEAELLEEERSGGGGGTGGLLGGLGEVPACRKSSQGWREKALQKMTKRDTEH
jgi:hypothetical protein